MILILQNTKIIAMHDDSQTVSFDLYPSSTAIKKIPDGTQIPEDGTDPTIAAPSLILEEEYNLPEDWPIDRLRTNRLVECNLAVNLYIREHYDLGTQSSFMAFYAILLDRKIEGALTPQEQYTKSRIEEVHSWIQTVMSYYYTIKHILNAATDAQIIAGMAFDFEQYDALDPGVQLEEFYE